MVLDTWEHSSSVSGWFLLCPRRFRYESWPRRVIIFFLANMNYMLTRMFAKFFRFSTDGYLKYALLNITEPWYLSLSCQNLKVLLNLMSRLSRGRSFRPNMIYIKKKTSMLLASLTRASAYVFLDLEIWDMLKFEKTISWKMEWD